MPKVTIMIYANIANFVKDHSMIEINCLKNAVTFIQTILSFVVPRKITKIIILF